METKIVNHIGIDSRISEELIVGMNELLSNFQVHYQNLRGLHWNIKGKSFFELHIKFEEYYTDAQEKIDMIAERILTLEGTPLHRFEDYLEQSEIAVGYNVADGVQAVQLITASLGVLLKLERNLLILSGQAEDEGTNALMSDIIAEQEKTVWMLNAWLS